MKFTRSFDSNDFHLMPRGLPNVTASVRAFQVPLSQKARPVLRGAATELPGGFLQGLPGRPHRPASHIIFAPRKPEFPLRASSAQRPHLT